MNFNSNPCIGNNDNPPIAPKIIANGAVHAGHPGVNIPNIPPNKDVEFDLTEFIIFILLILNATIAKLILPKLEIIIVKPIDVEMYNDDNSIAKSKCVGSIDIVKKIINYS